MDIQKSRRRKAWGLLAGVAAVVGAAVALSSVARTIIGVDRPQSSLADTVVASALSEDGADEDDVVGKAMASAGGWAVDEDQELPDWFSEELFDLERPTRVYVLRDGSVVGFMTPEPQEEVMGHLEEELGGRGWKLVESGTPFAVTGVKEGGDVLWLSLSCTQISNETCVVVQVPLHP